MVHSILFDGSHNLIFKIINQLYLTMVNNHQLIGSLTTINNHHYHLF